MARATNPESAEEVAQITARLRGLGVELYRQAHYTTLRPKASDMQVSGITLEDARLEGLPSDKRVGLKFSFTLRLRQGFECKLLDCPPLAFTPDC